MIGLYIPPDYIDGVLQKNQEFLDNGSAFPTNSSPNNNYQVNNQTGLGLDGNALEQWLNNLGGGTDYERNLALQLLAQGFNAEQSQINRDWQEYMSNTSYQRAVEDMKSAGLNPYLAYGQGGATTPSGSSASVSPNSGASKGTGGQLLSFISSLVGNAFSVVNTSLRNHALEEVAELKMSNAYDLAEMKYRNQFERDLRQHEMNKTYLHMKHSNNIKRDEHYYDLWNHKR